MLDVSDLVCRVMLVRNRSIVIEWLDRHRIQNALLLISSLVVVMLTPQLRLLVGLATVKIRHQMIILISTRPILLCAAAKL